MVNNVDGTKAEVARLAERHAATVKALEQCIEAYQATVFSDDSKAEAEMKEMAHRALDRRLDALRILIGKQAMRSA